jgi:hypothetical protein
MPKSGSLLRTRKVEIGEDYRRLHAYAVRGQYVLLAFSDTGVGMDSATLKRIFAPRSVLQRSLRPIGIVWPHGFPMCSLPASDYRY